MKTNKHHKIPKSRGGSNDAMNIKKRDVGKHLDRHVVFGNDTPVEQLIKVLVVNSGCRGDRFRKALIDLFKEYNGDYYKQECLKTKTADDLSKIL